jgi:hypothetical protein
VDRDGGTIRHCWGHGTLYSAGKVDPSGLSAQGPVTLVAMVALAALAAIVDRLQAATLATCNIASL